MCAMVRKALPKLSKAAGCRGRGKSCFASPWDDLGNGGGGIPGSQRRSAPFRVVPISGRSVGSLVLIMYTPVALGFFCQESTSRRREVRLLPG